MSSFSFCLRADFKRLNKKKQIEIILRGVNIDDDDFLQTNTILTKSVQNFILQTKRFSVKD